MKGPALLMISRVASIGALGLIFLAMVTPASAQNVRGISEEAQETKTLRIQPPAGGRVAFVADGNSPDPDDIGATAVMLGLLNGAELEDRLVHLSHSCDLEPFRGSRNPISKEDELRRQSVLQKLCEEGIALFGPFPAVEKVFNCRVEQHAAVENLKDAINASSAGNPLWIIEAGEPDVIGFALAEADAKKSRYVHVVSHHPANDNSGDHFTWKQILQFGVREHQIGDQNVGLQTRIAEWDWAKVHSDPAMRWIWERLSYAERDGVVRFQTNKFDCSDAGMIYWWITGANRGGIRDSTPREMRMLLLGEVSE